LRSTSRRKRSRASSPLPKWRYSSRS
jgi:hypothetical protein